VRGHPKDNDPAPAGILPKGKPTQNLPRWNRKYGRHEWRGGREKFASTPGFWQDQDHAIDTTVAPLQLDPTRECLPIPRRCLGLDAVSPLVRPDHSVPTP
jgi:hypothetical protein